MAMELMRSANASAHFEDGRKKKALEILSRDFVDPDSLGPTRVAQVQYNEPNPDLQADVAGYIRELLGNPNKQIVAALLHTDLPLVRVCVVP
jgi:hypothetical protein